MRRPPGSRRRHARAWLLALVAFLLPAGGIVPAEAAPTPIRRNEPSIGYVFPAGGRVGTSFIVSVGGQFLRNVSGAHLSGGGVEAVAGMWIPPPQPLNGDESRTLLRKLAELVELRMPSTPGTLRERAARARGESGTETPDAKLPDHPLLEDLETKSLDELQEVARYFFTPRNPVQRKRSIEETVKVRVTVAADAEPGFRDLRLVTSAGVTNPIRFQVGLLPEVKEREPLRPGMPETPIVDTPVVFNGQILPRDVDRYRFRAKEGQRLLVRTQARALVPYQADSVPGWMQATVAVFAPDGTEIAYADEYQFEPDPVLFVTVPTTGEYVVEVRDAIERGREDFVYRLTIGELPFVTRIFPLGGRQGELVNATIEGWNLGWEKVPLDTRGDAVGARQTAWRIGDAITNEVAYAVDTLPEEIETEPNDAAEQANVVELPRIVNGTIGQGGDVDTFRFEGRGGAEVVVEVRARQLGSPLDSAIRLTDEKGVVLAWNDDAAPEGLGVRGLGLQTHHADSYLRARLPRGGTWFVRLTDVTGHGGPGHAYRLRLSPPRPDVELYVAPSTINLPAGRTTLVAVRAVRKDGFDGDVDITLEEAPEGFLLGGACIPRGSDRIWMTLTAPTGGSPTPLTFRFVGRCRVGHEDVVRPVVPAEDVMQAFLWRHLVPAEALAVSVVGEGKWIPIVELVNEEPVRIPRGGKAEARFRVSRRVPVEKLRFELVDGPPGIELGTAKVVGEGFTLEIRASADAARTDTVNNLIVEAFVEEEVAPPKDPSDGEAKTSKKDRRARRDRQRYSLGVLPAIPYVIRRG